MSTPTPIDRQQLIDKLSQQTSEIQKKLAELKGLGDNLSIEDMFKMQMLMNQLSQLSEMSSSVMSAMNSAISSMARNVKG